MKRFDCRAFCLVLLLAAPAHAQEAAPLIAPGLGAWQELTFRNLAPNRWREEAGALVVESDASVSVLYRAVTVDLSQRPVLRWRWRVDAGPPPTDLTRKGGDDRALALSIGFAYEPAKASLGERMKRVVVEAVAGADAPGRVIDLVWGGTGTPGEIMPDPYNAESGAKITLRRADHATGDWVAEQVDLAALYRARFGDAPPPVVYLAVTADSDDTGSTVRARIADIRFEAR